MAMKSFKKIIMTAVALSLSAFLVMPVQAADNAAADEQIMVRGGEDYIDGFDPVFYANKYPDVYAAFGNDAAMLYQHYLLCGKAEGRWPNAAGPAGTSAAVVQPTGLLTTAGTYLSEEYVYNKIMGRKNVPGYTEGTYYTNGTRYYNTVSCEGWICLSMLLTISVP